MKKIICNKLYDTEKATLIHWWDNGHDKTDLNFHGKGLYLTQKEVYFIAMTEGAMKKYASRHGNASPGGGENIEVLNKEETIDWLQNHNGVSALEEHFKNVIEKG